LTARKLYSYFLFAIALIALAGCRSGPDTRVTLWRNDKIPYGTWYAFNSLTHLFKQATVDRSAASPVYLTGEADKKNALVIISKTVFPSPDEVRSLLNYAALGNYVFISGFDINKSILDSFGLKTSEGDARDTLALNLIHPETFDSLAFTYPGFAFDKYFKSYDTSITNVLGTDRNGRPDFVSFTYDGGGAIFFHLAPMAFTNYFLLHNQNISYYDIAISQIPAAVEKITWDDYFRHHFDGQDDEGRKGFSKLGLFLHDPVLKWAFWLTILLIGIVYIFESKRKQRILPFIKPLKNTSLDFVETIGRLYYQQKDNSNLFAKITTQFMGHIRSRYKLSSSEEDNDLEKGLAFKSGYDPAEIKDIFEQMRRLNQQPKITDDDLLTFNDKISKFYKQT
jgi:hypothetical protein